mmetsp:Transcript_1249/g.2869  ORF Transcript_1249/g.2869 Transcript_1249/m.2869 type:complete len:446 (-) Transcript_1249:75-1412(-)
MLRCCCCGAGGCHKSDAGEPEVGGVLLDISLLEATPVSVQLGIGVPRRSGLLWLGRGNRGLLPARTRRQSPPLEFLVSIVGGPDCDWLGARTERFSAPAGSERRFVHEVSGLQPDTEYTLVVSLVGRPPGKKDDDSGSGGTGADDAFLPASAAATGGQRLEVRTAPAAGGTLLSEGLMEPALGKEGKGGKGGWSPEAANKASGSLLGRSPRLRQASARGGPASNAGGDETSTAAPSDLGEDAAHNLDVWEEADGSDCEQQHQAAASQRGPECAGSGDGRTGEVSAQAQEEVADVAEVSIIEAAVGPTIRCDLCSMWDCFNRRRPQAAAGAAAAGEAEVGEIVVEPQVATAAAPTPVAPRVAPTTPSAREATTAAPPTFAPSLTAALWGEAEAPRPRKWTPYRIPFPGTPVDAASVGLANLERENARQLRERLAARAAAEAAASQR